MKSEFEGSEDSLQRAGAQKPILPPLESWMAMTRLDNTRFYDVGICDELPAVRFTTAKEMRTSSMSPKCYTNISAIFGRSEGKDCNSSD